MRYLSSPVDSWNDTVRAEVNDWMRDNGLDPRAVSVEDFEVFTRGDGVYARGKKYLFSPEGDKIYDHVHDRFRMELFEAEVSEPPQGVWS